MTTDGRTTSRDDLEHREPFASSPEPGDAASGASAVSPPTVLPEGLDAEPPPAHESDAAVEAPPEASAVPTGAEQLAPVLASLARMEQRLEARDERAAARERVIDRQHDEIEQLRAERRSNHLRPTVTDLCRLRNDLLRQAATLPADLSPTDTAALLSSYADTVEEALERCGVQVLVGGTGTAFTAGRHQVATVVETDDQALDATVAEVLQDGYADTDGAIVSPARVKLYRYVLKETTDE